LGRSQYFPVIERTWKGSFSEESGIPKGLKPRKDGVLGEQVVFGMMKYRVKEAWREDQVGQQNIWLLLVGEGVFCLA
jgi:hypothetical protein